MKFDAVLLIDCWDPILFWDTKSRIKNAQRFYTQLLHVLKNHEFDKVIWHTKDWKLHRTCPRLQTKIASSTTPNKKIIQVHADTYYDLYQTVKKDSKILVGGSAWQMCVHGNHLGLWEIVDEELQIVSHPLVVDNFIDNTTPITSKEFENDPMINWYPMAEGFFHALHRRRDIIKIFKPKTILDNGSKK